MKHLQGETERQRRLADIHDEERQQQAWNRMMRTRAKECRAYRIPIFLTPALVAQLHDKTSPRQQQEALTILQEGTRMLNQERETHCRRQQAQQDAASCCTVAAGSRNVSNESNDSGRTTVAKSWNLAASDRRMVAGSSRSDAASDQTMATESSVLSDTDSRNAGIPVEDETDSSEEETMINEAEQTRVWESLKRIRHLNELCEKYGASVFLTDAVVRQLRNAAALTPHQRSKLLAAVRKGCANLRLRRYRRLYSSIVWDETDSSSNEEETNRSGSWTERLFRAPAWSVIHDN